MPLVGVTLDAPTLGRGSDAQRADWEANIRELVSQAVSNIDPSATLRLGVAEEHFDLELVPETGEPIGAVIIEHTTLSKHIDEYLDILAEAIRARNGWKRILGRCSEPLRPGHRKTVFHGPGSG